MATTPITEQLNELESKALSFIKDAQAPVTEYVGKLAEALAGRLPEDRPDALNQGIDVFVSQVDFAKKLLDAQSTFVKSVLDAAVKPVRPVAPKPKTVKAA
jgi:hypothetical protein